MSVTAPSLIGSVPGKVALDAAPLIGRALPNAHRRNGFDALRILAAMMVVYGHAFPLTGHIPPALFGNAVGTVGVKIFFVISGFLVTRSWLGDARLAAFAMRRALRILPALACVVTVTVLLVGPIFTTLPLPEYFASPATHAYFWNVGLYPDYFLPGVFAGNRYPIAVNGSLWSLPAEVLMYILTPLVISRSAETARVSLLVFAACCAIADVYFARIAPPASPTVIYGTNLASVLEVAVYFQAGAIWAVFGLERYARPGFAVLLMAVAFLTVRVVGGGTASAAVQEMLLILVLPFASVSLGCVHLGGAPGRLLARADISYGLYLYGFPAQQAVAATLGRSFGPIGNFVLVLPLVVACACLSWIFVERPALRLKPRGRRLARS
ncbi:MAG TPA: acyltransferase [Acetobacteraceae bacterium]|nr:acyltransferase [Acetobacteraceae bacterium]